MSESNTDSVFSALGIDKNAQPPVTGEENPGGQPGSQPQFPEGFEPKFFGEEFTDWEKVKTEIPQRLSRLQELQNELESLRSSPIDFASPEIAEFNAFAKNTGVADYNFFNKVKTVDENVAPVELLVLKQVSENPAYRGKEEVLKQKIMREYQIDPDVYTADEIELNKIKLEEDAKKAGQWLSELKGKMQVIAPDPEAQKAKKLERAEAWKSKVQELVSKFDKLPIPIPDGDKFKLLTEYELKEDVRNRYIEPLTQGVQELDVSEDYLQRLDQSYRAKFVYDNLPYIVDHISKTLRAQWDAEQEAKLGGELERGKVPGGGSHGGGEDVLDTILRTTKY